MDFSGGIGKRCIGSKGTFGECTKGQRTEGRPSPFNAEGRAESDWESAGPGNDENADDGHTAGSLSEGFKRHLAGKVNSTSRESAIPRGGNNAEADLPPDLDPGVQRVLKIFKGTIIEENNK